MQLRPILLVEDDVNDRELTLAALAQHNIANQVVALRDGAEALDFLYGRGSFGNGRTEAPAVVLLDLKMPKVDGLQVLATMKGDPTLQSVPVVMLTSSREERDMVESYRLGANAYVVKPVEFAAFVKAVEHVGCFWALVNEPAPQAGGTTS